MVGVSHAVSASRSAWLSSPVIRILPCRWRGERGAKHGQGQSAGTRVPSTERKAGALRRPTGERDAGRLAQRQLVLDLAALGEAVEEDARGRGVAAPPAGPRAGPAGPRPPPFPLQG